MLTQSRALELLEYDPQTGCLTWKVLRGGRRPGDVAGTIGEAKPGYFVRQVRVDGVVYWSHRLIWFMVTGCWPDQIDHQDHDPLNNEWKNLRDVTSQQNNQNRSIGINNTSGFMGVFWEKNRSKWRAQIDVDGKKIHLGLFVEKSDAIIARQAANERYGFHRNHGQKK